MGKVYRATEMSDEHAAPGDVTKLLHAWADGDKRALDELIPLVYEEIHRLARNRLRREESHYKSPSSEIVAILFDLPEMVAILERPLRD